MNISLPYNRFCEMGLWTGVAERFKSAACSLFFVDIKNPLKTIQKTWSTISHVPTLPKVGKVSDFLSPDAIIKPSIISPAKLPDAVNILPILPINPLSDKKSDIFPKPDVASVLPTNPLSKQKTENSPKTTDAPIIPKSPLSLPKKNPVSIFG